MTTTLKSPEEMACGLSVGYEICDTQQDIFTLSIKMGFDNNDFIQKYMNSDFVKRNMDVGYSWFQMADAEDCMDFITKEFTPKRNDMHYDYNAIEWIGWMYKYMQLRFEIPSKDIYAVLPLEKMLMYYPGMHTQDPEYFIDIVKENFKR